MYRSSNRLVAAALALLLLGGTRASAELINWSYTWTASPDLLHANPGSGTVRFLTFGGSPASNPGDTSSLPVYVYYSSTAPAGSPDQFNKQAYTLTLGVTDADSSLEHDFTLTGYFQGTLTSAKSGLGNTYTGPTTQSFTLGTHVYSVAFQPYAAPLYPAPPGAPGPIPGVILASVTVTDSPAKVPEPSGLVLGGLTLPLLGLRWWRSRRPRS